MRPRLAPALLALLLALPSVGAEATCETAEERADLGLAQVGEEASTCTTDEDAGGPTFHSRKDASRTYVADERFTRWEVSATSARTTSERTGASFARECEESEESVEARTRTTRVEVFDRASSCEGHDPYGPESTAHRSRGVDVEAGVLETGARADRSRWEHEVPGSHRDHQDAALVVGFLALRSGSVRSNGFPTSCAVNGFPQAPPVCDAFYWGLAPVAPLP